MARWKSKCVYRAGRYPVIALVDLCFILLVLFVLSNSTIYLPGVYAGTDLGQKPDDDMQLSFTKKDDFSQYVVADKMVLTIDDEGGMTLNMHGVTMENLENELDKESTKLLRMYSNKHNQSQHSSMKKGFRPRMVISASSTVSVEMLDEVLRKVRDKRMDVVLKMRKVRGE